MIAPRLWWYWETCEAWTADTGEVIRWKFAQQTTNQKLVKYENDSILNLICVYGQLCLSVKAEKGPHLSKYKQNKVVLSINC